MADISLKRYNIDSAMELMADQYQAELPNSVLLRGSTSADRIFLQSGLLSTTGGQLTIASISSGIIDEYETTIRSGGASQITTRIRGRDASYLVLDSYVRRIYKRQPISIPLSTTIGQPLQPPPANNPAGLPYVLSQPAYPGAPTILAGIFTASQIAADICALVGVQLSWGVRDYTMLEDFSAVGRVSDILRRLIEPWTLVEPMRADLFFRGNAVVIQQRPFPITAPDYTFALSDLRREQATIRKRRTKRVGVLTLNGQKLANVSPNEKPDAGIFNLFVDGTQIEEDTQETFNPPGNLVSVVHTIRTYSMPNHTLLNETKETYTKAQGGALVMTLREAVNNTWEPSVLDLSGARSAPRQTESLKTIERIEPSDPLGIFRVWDMERTGFSYDEGTFLNGETTETQTFSLEKNTFESKKLVVKTIRDKGSLIAEQTTEVYVFSFEQTSQFSGTFTSQFGHWVLQSRDTQTGAGRRAGGPGRGLPVKRQGAQGSRTGGSTQIQVISLLSSDIDAVDVNYSNANLTIDDLNFILAQFLAAQNLWEYEVAFEGPAQVWLQRGNTLQVNNIVAEDGSLIALPPLLITESNMQYDESSATPKVSSGLRAFGWQKT